MKLKVRQDYKWLEVQNVPIYTSFILQRVLYTILFSFISGLFFGLADTVLEFYLGALCLALIPLSWGLVNIEEKDNERL